MHYALLYKGHEKKDTASVFYHQYMSKDEILCINSLRKEVKFYQYLTIYTEFILFTPDISEFD